MSKSGEEFKFIIRRPLREPAADVSYQNIQIVASYPNFVYACPVNRYKDMSEEEHIRLAVAELKIRLIQDISNAEFEMEPK